MHYAKTVVQISHICTYKDGVCDGWASPNPLLWGPCKYYATSAALLNGSPGGYCTNPPTPNCPVSPYHRADLSISTIHRDLEVLIDQVKWHVGEYGEEGEERNTILILLDEALRRAKDLSVETAKKELDHGGVKPWR